MYFLNLILEYYSNGIQVTFKKRNITYRFLSILWKWREISKKYFMIQMCFTYVGIHFQFQLFSSSGLRDLGVHMNLQLNIHASTCRSDEKN